MNEKDNKINELHSECGSSEPYALQVTDDSMEDEFPKNFNIIEERVYGISKIIFGNYL